MLTNKFSVIKIFKNYILDEKIVKRVEKIVDDQNFSEESLNATAVAIRTNPQNYNFWIVHRKILKAFKFNPYKELLWIEELILEYPKNFICWNHRRIIASLNITCTNASTELKLTERILVNNSKNYFAYAHRQWAINTFKYQNLGLLTEEMRFTAELINEDIRNNSAWNQRYFIINQRGKIDFILIKKEFQFALQKIKMANFNESSWNYLRALLTKFGTKKLYQFQDAIDFCENEFYQEENECPQIIAFLIDYKIEMILDDVISDSLLNGQKVLELCNLMATRYDKIRKNYWKFVYKQFYYDKIMKQREKNDNVDDGGIKEDDSWKFKIGKKFSNDQSTIY